MALPRFGLFGLLAGVTIFCVALVWAMAYPAEAAETAIKLLVAATTLIVIATAVWFSHNRTRTVVFCGAAALLGMGWGPEIRFPAAPFQSNWPNVLIELPRMGLPMAACAAAAAVFEWTVNRYVRRRVENS